MPLRVETVERLEDAARALQSNRNARLMGGGTLVMRGINAASPALDTLVVVRQPEKQISPSGARIEIGAGVTMSAIIGSQEVSFLAPAARMIGGPAVRAAATVAGNLFARPPFGEFTTALLALGANLVIAGTSAPVPIEEFLRDRGRDPSRVVLSISVPRPQDAAAFRFVKVTRVKPKGAPVFSIAAFVPTSGGRISGARIAISNMGPTPARAVGAERMLEGQALEEQAVGRACAAMLEGLQPITDEMASEWYRREVAPVHLRRMLMGRER
jgi:CO/xanthine dehydrogenase FAD-binding subunit